MWITPAASGPNQIVNAAHIVRVGVFGNQVKAMVVGSSNPVVLLDGNSQRSAEKALVCLREALVTGVAHVDMSGLQ